MKPKPKPTEWWHEHNLRRNQDAQPARHFRQKWRWFIEGFAQALQCDEAKAKDLWERATQSEASFERAMAIMGGIESGRLLGAQLKMILDAGKITILSPDRTKAMDLMAEENGRLVEYHRDATIEDIRRADEQASRMAQRADGALKLKDNPFLRT